MLCSRHLSADLLCVARRHVSRNRAASAPCNATAPISSTKEGVPLQAWLAGLQLMEQRYEVAGRVLHLIAPLDVDDVMEMYICKGIDGDPYWARVWPSAISLAQQLLQRPHLVAGKRVADLGAGLGVAGIAAALAGAREVVLLDREQLALQCGLISAAASGVEGVQGLEAVQVQYSVPEAAAAAATATAGSIASGDGGGGVQNMAQHLDHQQQQQQVPAAQLLQMTQLYLQQRLQQLGEEVLLQSTPAQPAIKGSSGSTGSETSSSSSSIDQQQPLLTHQQQQLQQQQQHHSAKTTFSAVPFDWSSSSSSIANQFDVILACDVLYEASAVEPVAAAVPQLLIQSPGSLLLLADPPNRTAENRQRFVDLLSAAAPGGSLLLEESGVYQCGVNQLDPEMVGGVKGESVAVQFMAFRWSAGNDTIGIKLQ